MERKPCAKIGVLDAANTTINAGVVLHGIYLKELAIPQLYMMLLTLLH
jgi:hypothetical protein